MKTNVIGFLAAFAVLTTLFGVSYAFETGFFGFVKPSFEMRANSIVATCARDSYPPGCYDREIPKLMDEGFSMEDAFAVAKLVQKNVDGYFYCHILGHKLSAKETAKDPSKWTEVIARCPVGMCSNGCLHGAAQERFRAEELSDEQIDAVIPDLARVCEPQGERSFTELEKASCYHSLGHLSMYMSGADTPVALEVCNSVARETKTLYAVNCYEGAFMQIFQPLEPEDFGLVRHIGATTQERAQAYCSSFSGEYRAACSRESWPLYRTEFSTSEGIEAFCSLTPDIVSKRDCYSGVFYMLAAQSGFVTENIEKLCTDFPALRKAQCYANAASRFLEVDYELIPRAVELCKLAEADGVGERCYDELLYYSWFNFNEDSPAFKKLCGLLPEARATACRNREGSSIRIGSLDIE